MAYNPIVQSDYYITQMTRCIHEWASQSGQFTSPPVQTDRPSSDLMLVHMEFSSACPDLHQWQKNEALDSLFSF